MNLAEKLISFGAIPITFSDSSGTLYSLCALHCVIYIYMHMLYTLTSRSFFTSLIESMYILYRMSYMLGYIYEEGGFDLAKLKVCTHTYMHTDQLCFYAPICFIYIFTNLLFTCYIPNIYNV